MVFSVSAMSGNVNLSEKSNIIELIAVLPSIIGTVLVFPYFQTNPFEEASYIVFAHVVRYV